MVSTVLKELQGKHDFFLVKLNGLIHTDDNLALKEIVQTLNADESIVEEASGSFAGQYFINSVFSRSDSYSTLCTVVHQHRFKLRTRTSDTLFQNDQAILCCSVVPFC